MAKQGSTNVPHVPPDFQQRPGTGEEYETLMVAHLALQMALNVKVEEFKISFNDLLWGDFEALLNTGKEELTAIQLKHKESKKNLKVSDFCKETGNYSLIKYNKSYQKLKNGKKNFKLALFTNNKFTFTNDQSFNLGQDTIVKIKNIAKDELDLITDRPNYCFKFEVDNIQKPDTLETHCYRQFFSHFYLCTNQRNIPMMEQDLSKIYKNNFSDAEENLLKFTKYIDQWSKSKTQFFLTKTTVLQLISLQILTPFIKPLSCKNVKNIDNKYAVIIKEIVDKFAIIMATNHSYPCLQSLYVQSFDVFANDKFENEIKDIIKKYQLIQMPQNLADLDDITKSKIVFLMENVPLLVEYNNISEKVLKFCQGKKIIAFSNSSHKANVQLSGFSVFTNLFDLLTEPQLLDTVLTTFKCELQGRQIDLKKLSMQREEILKSISLNELILMAQSELEIGGKLEILPVEHIPRLLTKNIFNLKNFEIDDKTTILISCSVKIQDVEKLFPNFSITDLDTFHPHKVIDQEFGLGERQQFQNNILSKINKNGVLYVSKQRLRFEEIEEKLKNIKRSCKDWHYFHLTSEEELEWIYSKGSIENLRKLSKSKSAVTEENLKHFKNEIVLVIGEPGMGKTTLLQHIKNNCNVEYWTILVSPHKLRNYFQLADKNNLETNFIERFSIDCEPIEQQIINVRKQNRKIVILWDAFDELSEEDFKKAIRIVMNLSEQGFKQFLTSRSHLAESLEKQFNVFARRLQPLQVSEQNTYIRKRLPNCDSKVIKSILDYTRLVQYNDILGIPLQIAMLVDLIAQDEEKYAKSIDHLFSVANLYKYSIDEKLKIYLNRKQLQINEKIIKYLWKDFEKISFNLFFEGQTLNTVNVDECNEFLIDLQKEGYNNGIVVGMTENGLPIFIHQSYAEYLAARHLHKFYRSFSNLDENIFQDKFRKVRYFFDIIISEGCNAYMAYGPIDKRF